MEDDVGRALQMPDSSFLGRFIVIRYAILVGPHIPKSLKEAGEAEQLKLQTVVEELDHEKGTILLANQGEAAAADVFSAFSGCTAKSAAPSS